MEMKKVYVIGVEYDDFSAGGFDISFIMDSLEKAQERIKEMIKETKEYDEEIEWTEEERQEYIKNLTIREFILNNEFSYYEKIELN